MDVACSHGSDQLQLPLAGSRGSDQLQSPLACSHGSDQLQSPPASDGAEPAWPVEFHSVVSGSTEDVLNVPANGEDDIAAAGVEGMNSAPVIINASQRTLLTPYQFSTVSHDAVSILSLLLLPVMRTHDSMSS